MPEGVEKTLNKIITLILILFILNVTLACAVDDTTALTQLNERLERNKAEIIKAINDANTNSRNATGTQIDNNFGVLDKRIQEFFKDSKRDLAIVLVGAFIVGFALSQLIRISIERRKRGNLIKKAIELDTFVITTEKEAMRLNKIVAELKAMEKKYTEQLKALKPKKGNPIVSFLVWCFVFLLGMVMMWLLIVQFKVI